MPSQIPKTDVGGLVGGRTGVRYLYPRTVEVRLDLPLVEGGGDSIPSHLPPGLGTSFLLLIAVASTAPDARVKTKKARADGRNDFLGTVTSIHGCLSSPCFLA